jgi:ERCC4-type nuclease
MAATFEFVMDTREKDTAKKKALEMYPEVIFEALSSGDFAGRTGGQFLVGAERKELKDFVGSTKTKNKDKQPRIFDQMIRLRQDYPIAFLILEGDFDSLYGFYKKFGLHFNEPSFWGTVTSIAVRDNVHILWSPRLSKTIDMAYRVCEKIAEGKYRMPKQWKPKDTNNALDLLSLVISEDIAKKLLNKYNSIQSISSLSLKELQSNDGIGPSLAKRLKNCLCKYEPV